jgi:TolB protein
MQIAYAAGDGIHVMNRDGSNDHWLSSTNRFDRSPIWSPDGRSIAFVYQENFNWEVYVMASDGSGRQNLSQNPTTDRDPAWRPLP